MFAIYPSWPVLHSHQLKQDKPSCLPALGDKRQAYKMLNLLLEKENSRLFKSSRGFQPFWFQVVRTLQTIGGRLKSWRRFTMYQPGSSKSLFVLTCGDGQCSCLGFVFHLYASAVQSEGSRCQHLYFLFKVAAKHWWLTNSKFGQ